jgi:hypothetical protein|uniref:Uncharacterized protein n=1 Tax=Phaeodactylum tricornutum TaxID=2850 RepID=A0A8J9TXD8_PHATR
MVVIKNVLGITTLVWATEISTATAYAIIVGATSSRKGSVRGSRVGRRKAALVTGSPEVPSRFYRHESPLDQPLVAVPCSPACVGTCMPDTSTAGANHSFLNSRILEQGPRTHEPLAESPLAQLLVLPRRFSSAPSTLMMDLELTLGRASMIAAFILFLVEVATGLSLPEQLACLVTVHS